MRQAFVLQLGSETETARRHFEGCIEEVDTGRELRFRSTDELLEFLGKCFDERLRNGDEPGGGERVRNGAVKQMMLAVVASVAVPVFVPDICAQSTTQQEIPRWVERGIPSAGHAALAPLIGSWRVELSVFGTMGRTPDLPPLVSRDIRTNRVWIAD